MYKGVQMSVTVRKNFVLDADVAKHLEEIAQDNNQSMTSLIEEMVEERYGSIKVKKRMQALANMKAFASGPGRGLLVGKSVQSIKADMDV
jgi:predicted transcriptional regulator